MEFLMERKKGNYLFNLFLNDYKHTLSFELSPEEYQSLKDQVNKLSEIRKEAN